MKAKELFEQAEELRGEEKLERAIEIYSQALSTAKEEGSRWFEGESLHMIGLVFYQQKSYEVAMDFFEQAEVIFQDERNGDLVGAVLRDKAAVAVEQGELERAKALLMQSIMNLESGKLRGHLGISKVKLGGIYQKEGKLDEAERFIREGIEDIKDSNERFFESSAYFSLAKLQAEQKQFGEAKLSAERSLEILEKISPEGHQKKKEVMRKFTSELNSY